MPTVSEQQNLAEVLDTVDEAIRKTEAIIAKLKQVKQGLLHDLLTRGIDENGELRDPERHPEQFKDSPLGRVPTGWQVGKMEDWLSERPKNGYSPQPVFEWTGRLMLGLGCLTAEGFRPIQLKNAPTTDRRVRACTLRTGDLLMSRANTRELVGMAGVFEDVGHSCSYPDLMMRLVPSQGCSADYLEEVIRASPIRRQIEAAAVGTSSSMVKISGAIVRKLAVVMPGFDEQLRILYVRNGYNENLSREEAALSKLRLLKQGLMEDLLTGRVRVTPLLAESAP